MKISRHQLAKIFGQRLMKSPVKASVFAQEIASYLLAEGRTVELEPLLRDISNYRAQCEIIELTAVSAHELSPKDLSDIELYAHSLYPNAKTIITNLQLDPSLVGGVRLEIVDQQLDLSVRTKLNRMKRLNTERTAA